MKRLLTLLIVLSACAGEDAGTEPIDECATCGGPKADGRVPEAGSCEAEIAVDVANEATLEELDFAAGLHSTAAEGIEALRPFRDMAHLDAVPYVGVVALEKLVAYGQAEGYTCDDSSVPPVTPPSPPAVDQCVGDAAVLWAANEASLTDLDEAAGLDSRAAQNLVDGRPFQSLAEVDAVSYVGLSALGKLEAFGTANGACTTPTPPMPMGLAIISDLDKTVVPPSNPDLGEAPYPGVVTLYEILSGGLAGTDRLNYVTARTPDRVVEMPDYLEAHGLPTGPIDTGISGVPWLAQAEKVRDASRILDANPGRSYVLFGDTSHRDPEVYKEMRVLYPDRIQAGLIHMVNRTVSDHRLVGLHLFHNYAEAAAILAGLEIISEAQAREVYEAAVAEGLVLSNAEFQELLTSNGL